MEKFVQELGIGLGDMATQHIGVLRKLQKYLKQIQQKVAIVSDIDGVQSARMCQTVLHGDAHAWNIFWNGDVKTEKDKAFDTKGCVRFIDLTNFGTGRVAWEVLYFLTTSYHYDWDDTHKLLKDYYDTLKEANGGSLIGYQFQDFVEEYYLLALLYCAHHFANLHRTGKFSGKKAKKLRRQSTTVGKKGGKARKTIGNATQQTNVLLRMATDIFQHQEQKLFAPGKNV